MTRHADEQLNSLRRLLQAAQQPGTPDEKVVYLAPVARLFQKLDEGITERFDFPAPWRPARRAWIGPRRRYSVLRGRNVVYVSVPGSAAFECRPDDKHIWLDDESDRTACIRCHTLRLIYQGSLRDSDQFKADRRDGDFTP